MKRVTDFPTVSNTGLGEIEFAVQMAVLKLTRRKDPVQPLLEFYIRNIF
jgi:hypothetical protein